jgi:hypothetical protein
MWREAIADRISADELSIIGQTKRPLTSEEQKWIRLIEENAEEWSSRRVKLDRPFKPIKLPREIYVLVGDQIGDDGFTYRDDTICIDVAAMHANYGDAGTVENRQRLIRLLDHEYTHLLHHAWIRKHPISMATPFDRALRDLIVEGVGNYRSLSSKWVDEKGRLTPLARETLAQLQPIFVERLSKLRYATESEEPGLTKNLSRGPFNKKWGALSMALWLAQDVKGSDRKLGKWIRRGPQGVMKLALIHLPEDLRSGLPQ